MVDSLTPPSLTPGPRADAESIEFVLPDEPRSLRGVYLEQELGLPGDQLHFAYRDDVRAWVLRLPRPPVHRMEYKLRLEHQDGGFETVNDPHAHGWAPGAFGDKSVLEAPEYVAPKWLAHDRRWWVGAELSVQTKGGPIEVQVLSPATPTRRLLLAHDGPEYDRLAGLPVFASAMVDEGRVPPFHLALVAPGPRNDRYSANVGYAAAFATRVIPALHAALRTTRPAVLMGPSLAGLAALHVQRRHPRNIGGLYLQSSSFFTPQTDGMESGFEQFRRITRWVSTVHTATRAASPIPITMTCGGTEENVHNNRLMAQTLTRQGYGVELHETPDLHNFTAWRDTFDPHLADLLNRVWKDEPDA